MKETKNETVFEDISSSSPKKVDLSAQKYADGAFKNIDKIVKAISFMVALGILLVFVAVAAVLVMFDTIFLILSIGLVILGVIIALITLFLIYGMGHILTQNKEILKRL